MYGIHDPGGCTNWGLGTFSDRSCRREGGLCRWFTYNAFSRINNLCVSANWGPNTTSGRCGGREGGRYHRYCFYIYWTHSVLSGINDLCGSTNLDLGTTSGRSGVGGWALLSLLFVCSFLHVPHEVYLRNTIVDFTAYDFQISVQLTPLIIV